MATKDDCCAAVTTPPIGAYRRVLWVVLVINVAMFGIEMLAGVWGRSVALQADALDFLGDSATYAITLIVIGMSVRWRSGAAMLKGLTMTGFGFWVAGTTIFHLLQGTVPDFTIMGSIGLLALSANVVSAGLLFRYRDGDSNMRSVWLCSRNDAIANIAVILAASGVWATGAGWPDLAVAAVISGLALTSGIQIIQQASGELRSATA
ncbi:MAG: cation transporter [Rhodospirillales bacterium]|nr:cation transporter [Rhodospirillales bacterium]